MSNLLKTKAPNQIKKIGIVGSSNMGRVVGLNWVKKRHLLRTSPEGNAGTDKRTGRHNTHSNGI